MFIASKPVLRTPGGLFGLKIFVEADNSTDENSNGQVVGREDVLVGLRGNLLGVEVI